MAIAYNLHDLAVQCVTTLQVLFPGLSYTQHLNFPGHEDEVARVLGTVRAFLEVGEDLLYGEPATCQKVLHLEPEQVPHLEAL